MSLCIICGNDVPSSVYRPKVYCSSKCRDFSKYKNALEKILIDLNPTKQCRSVIRGDMFRLANILSNGTKNISFRGGVL